MHEDSLMGRSMSVGASEATTILLAEPNGAQLNYGRGKSVAFDISKRSYPSTTSPSPNVLPKSILHRQGVNRKPATLSFADAKREPSTAARKIDFAHDDWYGMAPLASPETLSEISSISSRASLTMNLASSIEKYLNCIGAHSSAAASTSTDNDDSTDSQTVTPKVMRRTPKISTNLAACADDWRSVDKYKRMGKIFVTSPLSFHSSSGSSGENSYESPTLSKYCTASSNGGSHSRFDSTISSCALACPRCPCRTNAAAKCCRKRDHSSCTQTNTSSTASDTFYSALSSLPCTDTNSMSSRNFAPVHGESATRMPSGLLESHFPVFADNAAATPVVQRSNNGKCVSTSNGNEMAFRRVIDDGDDRCFAPRNEALPLLANLGEKSSPSRFGRRRNYVYPVTASPRPSPSKRSESSV